MTPFPHRRFLRRRGFFPVVVVVVVVCVQELESDVVERVVVEMAIRDSVVS